MTGRMVSGQSPEFSTRIGYLNQLDPTGHYARSQRRGLRIPREYLRSFVDTPPAQAALTRIVDGVVRMPWLIDPPSNQRNDQIALDEVNFIQSAMMYPNQTVDGDDTYDSFACALIIDLLVENQCYVERVKGDGEQAFWMWAVDPARIEVNPAWTPQLSGVEPRFFDTNNQVDRLDWRPLMNGDMFRFSRYTNTWRKSPPGPMEVAFRMIAAWLGLTDFQQATTSRATQEYLLDIGPVSQDELTQFREFFEIEVLQRRQTPIVGSKEGGRGITVVKMGAASDGQLYLQYYEKLLRIIALAFKLTARDYNEDSHDNRATAGIAADSTFQDAIYPMASTIIKALQRNIVGYYYPGYSLTLADIEPRDQLKEAETAKTLFEAGIITKNEARSSTGRNGIGPAGDKFADGTALGDSGNSTAVAGDAPAEAPQGKGKDNKTEKADKAAAPVAEDKKADAAPTAETTTPVAGPADSSAAATA